MDQLVPGHRVAVDGPFGQQVVGRDRARRVRPGRHGTQAGQGRLGGCGGRLQVGHGGADHDRPAAEPSRQLPRGGDRVAGPADDDDQAVAVYPGQQVEFGPAGDHPEIVDHLLGVVPLRPAGDHGDRGG